ncbi:DUF58 domain-containing protein [bacterium]|nr:DUF58 domain-containing protein [bacterium]
MTEVIAAEQGQRKTALSGMTTIFIAMVLVLVYYQAPFMRAGWAGYYYPLFWMFIASLVIYGVLALTLPTHWTQRLTSLSRHRMTIPREGIGYLLIMTVLFIGSSLTHSNTLLLVFAAMAGPFVVNGWVTYTMLKNVRASRTPPARAMVGELFSVEIDLENQTHLVSMWMMVAQDQVTYGHSTWVPTVLFTRVPSMSVIAGHYQMRLMQRGRHHFGPIRITSRFPLGLIERGCLFRDFGEMLIYPRIGRLSPQWKRRLLGASELIETPQPRSGVFDDEYHHLREYLSGDNPRAIHWRSSARRNQLIVREYQQNREHHLLLLVDLWLSNQPAETSRRLVEQALSLTATLCSEHRWECRGATLTVVCCGKETWRWEARANSSGLESLFDRLALVEPSRENDFVPQARKAMSQMATNTRVVAISPRVEAIDLRADASLPTESLSVAAIQWLNVDDTTFADLIQFPDELPRQPASVVTPVLQETA